MKKYLLKSFVVMTMMAGSVSAQAQISLGSVLGSVTDGASDLVSNLTSVFSSSKQATAENLVGTWVYSEPAVVFESDNFLTNTAAKVAANKIESKLQTQLSKYGIKPGAMSITFNSDGSFKETLGSKTLSGTWKVVDSQLQMTYAGIKTVNFTTQLSGSELQFVTDASKLLDLFKTVGNASGNSSIKTITSLMKSVKGMKAGITLKKQ